MGHDEGGRRTCGFNSQVSTTSRGIWFSGFLVSIPVTVPYKFTPAPIFTFLPTHKLITQNVELITTRQTLKKHTLMHTQHLKSDHMHCNQINYYTKGTLIQALIQFSGSIEVRLSFVNTITSSLSSSLVVLVTLTGEKWVRYPETMNINNDVFVHKGMNIGNLTQAQTKSMNFSSRLPTQWWWWWWLMMILLLLPLLILLLILLLLLFENAVYGSAHCIVWRAVSKFSDNIM